MNGEELKLLEKLFNEKINTVNTCVSGKVDTINATIKGLETQVISFQKDNYDAHQSINIRMDKISNKINQNAFYQLGGLLKSIAGWKMW